MHRSLYTQEIGMETGARTVPAPLAFVLLAAAATGAWMVAREVQGRMDARHAQEQHATAEATAQPAVARK